MLTSRSTSPEADSLLDQCSDLQLNVSLCSAHEDGLILRGPVGEKISVKLADGRYSMLEQVLRGIDFSFDRLPVLALGDSKDIRFLTPKIAIARLLPTVYSFTENRYGTALGTEDVRARFSAEIFRLLERSPGANHVATAFLGEVESSSGRFLIERVVESANIEVRVKRYHIGSPVHRYRYTERYSTAHRGSPLHRWSRFASPVVCFDWRHPMHDDNGNRLSDEPISDDYAGVWLDDAHKAKQLARDAFLWIEDLFYQRGLLLIDICFFVDKTGTTVYGEISPDCMRVRERASDAAEALDKDKWRSGGTETEVLARYKQLYEQIFSVR